MGRSPTSFSTDEHDQPEVVALSWRDIEVTALRALARGLSTIGDAYVWLVFHKDLREPLVPVEAKLPITIAQATAPDAAEMAAMWRADDPDDRDADAEEAVFRGRLRDGSLCLVARVDGRIVAFDWIRRWKAAGPVGVPMLFADDEVYTTDAYTASAWRGHRIHPALNHAVLHRAQSDGHRIAYTMARADNAQSLPTLRRMGWTPAGTLVYWQPRWAPDKPVWLVRGSPYPLPVGRLASTRVPSLAELYTEQGLGAPELLRSLPWSTTWRLHRKHETFDLMSVPLEHAADLRVASAVARALPEAVPPIVACNYATESWMLTRDPGGTRLSSDSPPPQLLAMLEAYAELQVQAFRKPWLTHLPAAPLTGLVDRLLAFLAWDDEVDASCDETVGAAYFIGRDDAQQLHHALEPCRAALVHHLELAMRLPHTLNHGNLHPFNAALRPDGSCVLLDWSWATSGPAGLSLHPLVGDSLPVTVLRPEGLGAVGRGEAHPLVEHYLRTLARGAYAPEGLLRQCLPASITAGLVLDALRWAAYPMEDPAGHGLLGDRLRLKLTQLLDLGKSLLPPRGQ
jgi:hypothetical protein